MTWTLLIAAPTLLIGEITDTTVELRAVDIPLSMETVIFRPIDAELADSLRASTADQPYLGYGALATLGPSSPDTLWVTSAEDEGAGTLRFHLETSPANDAVVAFDPGTFALDSTIDLTNAIRVRTTRTIIDGFTAQRAVTVRQHDSFESAVFVFDGSLVPGGSFDTVLRGLRILQGGVGGVDVNHTADGINLAGTANKIVIDHCDFGPARDEAIGFSGSQQWITVQWCTFHGVLKTFLVGADWSRTSVHHNFFYDNGERLLLAQGFPTHAGKLEYRNNVIVDWHVRGMEWREHAAGNMIGNAYLSGAGTAPRWRDDALEFGLPTNGIDVRDLVFAADNLFPDIEGDAREARRSSPWPIDPLVNTGEHPAVEIPTTDPATAIVDVLSEAGLGPLRDPEDLAAARIAFVGTRVDSVLEWIPREVASDVAHARPNQRLVFDCRAQGGNELSDFSEPVEVWTHAAVPPAPGVIVHAPGHVTFQLALGDNPKSTRVAIGVARDDAWTWLTPAGEKTTEPEYAPVSTWHRTTVTALSRLDRSFRLVARNGAGVVTEPSETTTVSWYESTTRLLPSFPNPFRSSTHLPFVLEDPGSVRLDIFDASGRLVRRLETAAHHRGYGEVVWDGRTGAGERLPSGVYFYRLASPARTTTQRVMLLR